MRACNADQTSEQRQAVLAWQIQDMQHESDATGDHRGSGILCAVSCKTMPYSTRSCLQNQRESTLPTCDKSPCSEPQVQAKSRP